MNDLLDEHQAGDYETKLANADLIMILGLLSLLSILSWCCMSFLTNIIGLIMAGVGFWLSIEDYPRYKMNPTQFTNGSNFNIGRILCIIGMVIHGLGLLVTLGIIIVALSMETANGGF